MKIRFAKPVATAATAILLLGACIDDDDSSTATSESTVSDDGPTTLAQGEDIDFVGTGELADQTMDISAQEEDGEVTGEISFEPHGSVTSLQCAETDTDGLVIVGGQFTTPPDDGDEPVGFWIAVAIREGEPDRASIVFAEDGTDSCQAVIDQVPESDRTGETMLDVEDGDDIRTS